MRTYNIVYPTLFIRALRTAYQRRGGNGVPDPKNVQYEPVIVSRKATISYFILIKINI